ncbi:aminotransferase class I/II-fold pyridoxal phosphate-dependent enzyme, partial [Porticoccaceae bacterium]|nr:aminotransferase class I/II-fold pyridoxal phosphate-dependent enzyme [Porticoccaceae bacterium]
NTVAPPVVAGAIKALEIAANSGELIEQLQTNTEFFRHGLEQLGFSLLPGEHPIVPIMLGDAAVAAEFAAEMLNQGVYVVAFSYPVVPQGNARIRTQMSAAHSREDVEFALQGFARDKQQLGI